MLYGKVKCFIYCLGLRSSGYFDLRDIEANKIGASVNYKKLKLLERARGRIEEVRSANPPRAEARGLLAQI